MGYSPRNDDYFGLVCLILGCNQCCVVKCSKFGEFGRNILTENPFYKLECSWRGITYPVSPHPKAILISRIIQTPH